MFKSRGEQSHKYFAIDLKSLEPRGADPSVADPGDGFLGADISHSSASDPSAGA